MLGSGRCQLQQRQGPNASPNWSVTSSAVSGSGQEMRSEVKHDYNHAAFIIVASHCLMGKTMG